MMPRGRDRCHGAVVSAAAAPSPTPSSPAVLFFLFFFFFGATSAAPSSAATGSASGAADSAGAAGAASSAAAAGAAFEYDLITIGAGSGGVRASRMSTAYGAEKVAVVELPFGTVASERTGGVGGTCVIRGCVPKKLLVYASEYAAAFKGSAGFGWEERERPGHDWGKLISAKNEELNRLTGAYSRTLGNADVEVLQGRGKVTGPHTVEVDGKEYSAKNILVAVGGLPWAPDVPGIEHAIVSDDALELPELPKSIAVVGGGYIALEFACIFNAMGVDTHVYYRQPLPLRGFDEEVRQNLADQLAASGLHLHPGESPKEIRKEGEDAYTYVTDKSEGTFGKVMFATGRRPNIAGLGLENVGVAVKGDDYKTGSIIVDDFSRTNVPSIYAIGDVTDRINLTPVALMEGMALAATLFKDQPTKPNHENVASAVFTQPPVATVGLTEEQAVSEFGDVDVFTSDFRPMKNVLSGSAERSFMKIVVDAKSDKVVGVHMVGVDSAEIMQGVGIAVKMGATKADFDATIGIHPTAAEELVTMRSPTRQIRK